MKSKSLYSAKQNLQRKEIPIKDLKNDERLWLQTVYNIIKEDKRPDLRDIWGKLYGKISNHFRPPSMDAALVSASGEEIKLFGIIALEKNYRFLQICNEVILATKEIILTNTQIENIEIKSIAANAKQTVFETSLVFHVINDYGSFTRGHTYTENHQFILNSVNVKGSDAIFYQYVAFENIEQLILQRLSGEKNTSTRNDPTDDLLQLDFANRINVQPIFRTRVLRTNPKSCFVIMPFKEDWSDRIFRNLKRHLKDLNIEAIRSDNLTSQNIVEDIWWGICQSAFVIADMTNKNPNVMYEMGIVHTVGKPSILITQNIESIPFDLRHLRHIEYRDNIDAIKTFNKRIKQMVIGLYDEHYHAKLIE